RVRPHAAQFPAPHVNERRSRRGTCGHSGACLPAGRSGERDTSAHHLGNARPDAERAVNDLPLSQEGGIGLQVTVDGAPPPPPDEPRFARYLVTSGGYFRAMGIPLVSGRVFTAADDSLAPKVVIVN